MQLNENTPDENVNNISQSNDSLNDLILTEFQPKMSLVELQP